MALILRPSISGGPIFGAALSGVPITGGLGTAPQVEDDDFVTISGLLALTATASLTEAADLLSSVSTMSLAGVAGITEAADTLSAAAGLAIVGASSLSEIGDIVSSAGGLSIAATLAKTEDADTVASIGAGAISGQTITRIRRAGISAYAISSEQISGKSTISLFLSQEDNDALVAAGAAVIVATAALTEASDTAAAGLGIRPVFQVITGGGGSRLRVVNYAAGPRGRLSGTGNGLGMRLRA